MFDFAILNDSLLLAQSAENQIRDLLVAVVSMGIGLNIFYAVLTSNGRCYEMGSVQMLERNFGRTNTNFILSCVGAVCLLMGVYLVINATSGDRKMVKTSWFSESGSHNKPITMI